MMAWCSPIHPDPVRVCVGFGVVGGCRRANTSGMCLAIKCKCDGGVYHVSAATPPIRLSGYPAVVINVFLKRACLLSVHGTIFLNNNYHPQLNNNWLTTSISQHTHPICNQQPTNQPINCILVDQCICLGPAT